MALYGHRTLSNDLTSPDMVAVIIFVIGISVLRRWKPNPLWVMAGSGVAGIILSLKAIRIMGVLNIFRICLSKS